MEQFNQFTAQLEGMTNLLQTNQQPANARIITRACVQHTGGSRKEQPEIGHPICQQEKEEENVLCNTP